MRAGPWICMSAIALLLAGIASTGGGGNRGELTFPLAVDGAVDFDIRAAAVDTVVFDAGPPVLVFRRFADRREVAAPTLSRAGDVARIAFAHPSQGSVELRLPPTTRRIVAAGGRFEARSRLTRLRIESTTGLSWGGDIGVLEIADTAAMRRCTPKTYCYRAYTIESGAVGALQIWTRDGHIDLAEHLEVGTVTLRTGPDARIDAARRVLDRADLQPFDSAARGAATADAGRAGRVDDATARGAHVPP